MMMRPAAFTICLAAAACAPARMANETSQVTVAVGGEAAAGGLRLRFLGVEADSRCRPGQQCLREGEARVIVATSRPGEAYTRRTILTSPPDSTEVEAEGRRLRLDSLSMPAEGGEDYRAWFTVEQPSL